MTKNGRALSFEKKAEALMQIDFARVEVYPKLLVNVGQNDSSLRTQIGPMQSAKTNPSHKQNINKYMYIYIIIYIYT